MTLVSELFLGAPSSPISHNRILNTQNLTTQKLTDYKYMKAITYRTDPMNIELMMIYSKLIAPLI